LLRKGGRMLGMALHHSHQFRICQSLDCLGMGIGNGTGATDCKSDGHKSFLPALIDTA
jgi:hypothetical protein